MPRTFSLSSAESLVDGDAALGAIAEETEESDAASSSEEEGEVVVVMKEETESDSESESDSDQDPDSDTGFEGVEEGEVDDSWSEVSGHSSDPGEGPKAVPGARVRVRAEPAERGDTDTSNVEGRRANGTQNATARSPSTLRLDDGMFSDGDDEDESDDDASDNAFSAAKFAAADENKDQPAAAARPRSPVGNSRASMASSSSHSLSPGPRGVAKARARASVAPGSRSLSPVPRGAGGKRASWSPGVLHPPSRVRPPSDNCLSPMRRLKPVDHGIGGQGNTVVLELGSWRVRAGVVAAAVKEGGEGDGVGRRQGERRKPKSYFDDFPCCVARPTREGADLDELVNGASSLASPMYSKFRE